MPFLPLPTMKPTLVFRNFTPLKAAATLVGSVIGAQLPPPLAVRRMVLLAPTAQPLVRLTKSTAVIVAPLPAARIQVAPLSMVRSIVPLEPTTQPVSWSTNFTALRDTAAAAETRFQGLPP